MHDEPFPPYSYVPGAGRPHPTGSPEGHSFGRRAGPARPIERDDWAASPEYLRGLALFNAGYYWEAHEAWEPLWLAHGRRGPTAEVLKGLIKLAAAGVKVREGQPRGVATHARRAAECFEAARAAGACDRLLGLDLADWADRARDLAERPPVDSSPRDQPVARVFGFEIEPGAG